jgi:hypothetical protein
MGSVGPVGQVIMLFTCKLSMDEVWFRRDLYLYGYFTHVCVLYSSPLVLMHHRYGE